MSAKIFGTPTGTTRRKWFINFFKGLKGNEQKEVFEEVCEVLNDKILKESVKGALNKASHLQEKECDLRKMELQLNAKAQQLQDFIKLGTVESRHLNLQEREYNLQEKERTLQERECTLSNLNESLERKKIFEKYKNAKFVFTSKQLQRTFQLKNAPYNINSIVCFMIEKDKYIVSDKILFFSSTHFEKFRYAFRLYICKRNFDKFAVSVENIRKKPLYELVQNATAGIDNVVCVNSGIKIGYIVNTDNVNDDGKFENTYGYLYDKPMPSLFKDLKNTLDMRKQQNDPVFNEIKDYKSMENMIEFITCAEVKDKKIIVLNWLNEL